MARTWIVAYDFAPQARAALARAAKLLSQLGGGTLVAVHVEGYRLDAAGADLVVGGGAEVLLQQEEMARSELARDLAAVREPGVELIGEVGLGRPAELVAEIAGARDAELVVVGSHGRRGLERMLLGSVAETIVRLAPCDVMVVKP
ncbi:MAG: universal stress protein [Myxococcota bacterium]